VLRHPRRPATSRPDLHDVAGRDVAWGSQLLAFGSQESGLLRVTHDLTQEEIAQLVGASRET